MNNNLKNDNDNNINNGNNYNNENNENNNNNDNNDNNENNENNDNNEKKNGIQETPRKRGRPRKYVPIETQQPKIIDKPKALRDYENREIILNIPLFDEDSDDNNNNNFNNKKISNMSTSNDERKKSNINIEFNKKRNELNQNELTNNQNININNEKNQERKQENNNMISIKSEYDNISDENAFTMGESEINNEAELTLTDDVVSKDLTDDDDMDVNRLLIELEKYKKFNKQLLNELNNIKNNVQMSYSENKEIRMIPLNIKFIDVKNGKHIICDKTDIACWHCTYQFDTLPCFIPEKNYNNMWYVFGNFCSFNCSLSHNLSLGDYKVSERTSLLKNLYFAITGRTDEIVGAPPKEVIKKYGGYMTIDEYRKGNKSISIEYKLKLPPMIIQLPYIEERIKEKQYNYVKSDKNNDMIIKNKKSVNIMDSVGIQEIRKKKLF